MKKKITMYLLVVVASLLVFSCGDLISNIQVKGSPTLYAPLGDTSFEISDYLSMKDISKMMGADNEGSSMKVYDYPFATAHADATKGDIDPDSMRFLVKYPITSLDFDFSQYLDEMNFDDQLNTDMPPQTFKIPSIASPDSQTIDFNAQLLATLNVIPDINLPLTIPVPGSTSLAIPMTLPGFTSAGFAAGEMTVNFTSIPSGLTITSVVLKNQAGTAVSVIGLGVPVTFAKTVRLPLTGVKDLSNEVQLSLGVTSNGKVNGDLNFQVRFANTTRLDSAEGVKLQPAIESQIPAMSIPAMNDPTFISAVVGPETENAINIEIGPANTNAVMTGFDRLLTLNVTQPDGLTVGITDDARENPSMPLAGKTINKNAISLSGRVSLSADAASFSNMGTAGLVFKVATDVHIEKFASVTLKAGEGFKFEQNITQPLPGELGDLVSSIVFSDVGLNLSFTNGLPAGNPLTFKVTSTAFDIDSTQQIEVLNPVESKEYSFTNTSDYRFVPKLHPQIDFNIVLSPPGYEKAVGTKPATMTLNNLAPGNEFSFSLDSVAMVSKWTSITVDPDQGFSGTFPEDGSEPLDMSALTDYLGDGLGFAEIPMYFYISGIDVEGHATIFASYTDKADIETTKYLYGTATDPGVIHAVEPLVIKTDSDNKITEKIPLASAELEHFGEVLNNSSARTISYHIDFDEIELKYAEIYNLDGTPKGATTLNADLVIVFPIAFSVSEGGADLNIPGFGKKEGEPAEDIFGRKEGSEDDSINKALSNLHSMELQIDYTNRLGLDATFSLTDSSTVIDPYSSSFKLSKNKGTSTLALSTDDIIKIKDTVPFTPEFAIRINDDFAMPRNAGIDLRITVKVVSDINETFSLKGGN